MRIMENASNGKTLESYTKINIWHDVLIELLNEGNEMAEIAINASREYSKPLDSLFKRYEDLNELKKYSLEKEFLNTLTPFDISEALEISESDAKLKIENNKFTMKENELLLDTFKGNIHSFLQKKKGALNAR